MRKVKLIVLRRQGSNVTVMLTSAWLLEGEAKLLLNSLIAQGYNRDMYSIELQLREMIHRLMPIHELLDSTAGFTPTRIKLRSFSESTDDEIRADFTRSMGVKD